MGTAPTKFGLNLRRTLGSTVSLVSTSTPSKTWSKMSWKMLKTRLCSHNASSRLLVLVLYWMKNQRYIYYHIVSAFHLHVDLGCILLIGAQGRCRRGGGQGRGFPRGRRYVCKPLRVSPQ
jgi:hypothetical protein